MRLAILLLCDILYSQLQFKIQNSLKGRQREILSSSMLQQESILITHYTRCAAAHHEIMVDPHGFPSSSPEVRICS